MKAPTLFISILLFAGVVTQSADHDIVDTNVGKVRGLKVTAVNGKSLWSFRGIRYAMPPVGRLRFAKPVPYPRARDTIDAREQPPYCIRYLSSKYKSSEDCLYLNIFLKDINTNLAVKKKVLVYTQSTDAFRYGSLVTDHDIIIVSVQHRDGPFGYLAIKSAGINGNYGLWDQVLALEWVKNNIGAFGGDADDVTFGGFDNEGILALTPTTKGLFTKVFAKDGMKGFSDKEAEQSDEKIINFAQTLNCWHDKNTTDLNLGDKLDIIQCLRSLPTLDDSKADYFNEIDEKMWRGFLPVTDGSFLPKSISALLKDDNYLEDIGFYEKKYFITISNNKHDTVAKGFFNAFQSFNDELFESDEFWEVFFLIHAKSFIADHLNIESVTDDLASEVLNWYETNSHVLSNLAMQTDLMFTIPTQDILDTIARSRKTSVWFLYFNHYPQFLKEDFRGMIFNLDLLYLFDMEIHDLRQNYGPFMTGEFQKEDDELKKLFSSIVASFVQNGNPENPLLTSIPTGWPIYDLVGRYYLDFNTRPTVKRNWKNQIRQLWQQDVPKWAYRQMEDNHIEL
ncbi:unnamed protein product [Lymnaea stagnalis]|uniref:Carboxylesterase type B domain-containing protein n=1 Tax=Lymnaea stagnalis TaxID=6523 RepID=A0AAV2IKA6_LYMST